MPNSIDPTSSPVRSPAAFEEAAAVRRVTYSSQLSSAIQDSVSVGPCGASEPTLSKLEEQIKGVMIPLLMDIFALKEEAEQSKNPPTRLSLSPKRSEQELKERLAGLEKDLERASLWIQTCLTQVKKTRDEGRPPIASKQATQSTLGSSPASWFKRLLSE